MANIQQLGQNCPMETIQKLGNLTLANVQYQKQIRNVFICKHPITQQIGKLPLVNIPTPPSIHPPKITQ